MKHWTKLRHIQHSVQFDITASLFLTISVASWVGFRRYFGVDIDSNSALEELLKALICKTLVVQMFMLTLGSFDYEKAILIQDMSLGYYEKAFLEMSLGYSLYYPSLFSNFSFPPIEKKHCRLCDLIFSKKSYHVSLLFTQVPYH